MKIVYETEPYRFEHDPALARLVYGLAHGGAMSARDIMDATYEAGHDPRSTAMEIGILLMDGVLEPTAPTGRISGEMIVRVCQLRRRRRSTTKCIHAAPGPIAPTAEPN